MGSGSRRLLVKTWVQVLQSFRDTGVVPLSETDVVRFIEGASQELEAGEQDTVAAEGE